MKTCGHLFCLYPEMFCSSKTNLSEKGGEMPMKQQSFNFPVPDGYVLKFVAYITVKGRRLYAKAYGKRAWPIWVKE